EIAEVATAVLLMGAQIEVGAVGDALELAPAEWEEVLDVVRCLGVVGQLVLLVGTQSQPVAANSQVLDEPAQPLVTPVGEELLIGARLAEVLHLHLLELAEPEDEVARRDLVAEGPAVLGDPEGEAPAGGVE